LAQKVTLIWDGLPSHRSKVMTKWIAAQRHWLVVERLRLRLRPQPHRTHVGEPKGGELANLCSDTIEEAASYADDRLNRIGSDVDMCFALLRHCGLSLR
jgi:putative transposase